MRDFCLIINATWGLGLGYALVVYPSEVTITLFTITLAWWGAWLLLD